jgi:hypothetical protein
VEEAEKLAINIWWGCKIGASSSLWILGLLSTGGGGNGKVRERDMRQST